MKSIEIRFSEAMDALKKAGRTKNFDEKAKSCTTIESKLACAEEVLKDAGVVRKESAVKHNGAADNGHEYFTESSGNSFSPGYDKVTNLNESLDKITADGLLAVGAITEAQHRKLTGEKPKEYNQLSEQQQKDFDFCRAIGISEADSLTVVSLTPIKEVSRR